MRRATKITVLALAVLAAGVFLVRGPGRAVAQNVACYLAQGGASFVASSGCTLQVDTGATFSLDGTSVTSSGAELNLLDGQTAGAFPPATCTPGQIFIDTDETVDTNCTTTADNALCYCVAANTWAANEP